MKGNRFEINETTNGSWTQVNAANIGVGWVCKAYIKLDGTQDIKFHSRRSQTNRIRRSDSLLVRLLHLN